MLCHYTTVVLTQVGTNLCVGYYDLLKVNVLSQPCWDLGHTIPTRAPPHNGQDTCFAMQICV
jgi:hypothetical protein